MQKSKQTEIKYYKITSILGIITSLGAIPYILAQAFTLALVVLSFGQFIYLISLYQLNKLGIKW